MSVVVRSVRPRTKLIFTPNEYAVNSNRKQSDKSVKSYTDEESK